MENPVLPSSCVTPADTSIEVQNEWEENTHTHRRSRKEFSWSRCTVDNVEFSLIKVAVRYIQYIAYTVLIEEMMQIV